MLILRSLIFAISFALPASAAELIMVDQDGCHYCERWTEEIGPIYPKTSEGKFAPLRRIDLREIPPSLDLQSQPAFTPTFILVEGGIELARIEGYPGEDFFWPLITKMFEMHTNFNDSQS